MGHIRSFDDALDFYPEAKRSLATRFGGFLGKVTLFWDAFREGQAAAKHYDALRRRGHSHEVAASKVFDVHFR
jgi:hypothetical protein